MPVSPFSLRLASFSSLRRLSYLFFISKISRSASSSICFLVSSYSRSCWRDSSCDCGGRSEKLNKEFAVCSNRTLGYRLSTVVKFAFLTDAKATTTPPHKYLDLYISFMLEVNMIQKRANEEEIRAKMVNTAFAP